ncbi:MAG: hypothetical protein Q8920_05520 [Bacillota bacterium]|nr:hypothetical protein [Bacillota bacterium]
MQDFDEFSIKLFEESKRFLEKAKLEKDNIAQEAFLHASLLISMSALEAHINSISEELINSPDIDIYNVYERALLSEKDVCFEKGKFGVSQKLKIYRISDRIEFLYYKYSGKIVGPSDTWYAELKKSIDLRNKLVHPKSNILLTIVQVENALHAVLNTINQLYLIIYKSGLPIYSLDLQSKFSF